MQDTAGIAQARYRFTIEQVGIDTRHLRGHISTYPERTSGQLIDQLEGPQIGILTSTGQQRFEILQQRRHDHFIAIQTELIEHAATQLFNLARFGWQDVSNIFGKKPIRHKTIQSVKIRCSCVLHAAKHTRQTTCMPWKITSTQGTNIERNTGW